MVTKIYIVEIINGEDLFSDAQAFCKLDDAENEFKDILKTKYSLTDEAIEICLEDGYFVDDTHFSVTIKAITLK